jgi:thioredoxin-related protein
MKSLKVFLPIVLIFSLGLATVLAVAASRPDPSVKATAKPAHKSTTAKAGSTKAQATATQSSTVEDKVHWVSFDKGVQLQKGTDKHLFVDFTTTWCGWCKKMEAETFSDTAVAHYINRNFVAVKVWADQDSMLDIDGYKVSQKDLASGEFQVTGYPTFWFVNTKKEKLGPLAGYQTKDQLMNILPVVAEYRYDSTRNKQNATPQPQDQGK